ncbi:caspase family protein [Okeanomitos corallinicola TIOX110]|uniref:Caspase family protein n=1 Tax=Okeanomitos corallinicola TIOX110 TaxID=3133117 RepID=A0ABZ2UY71_9CYAN
MTNYWAIAIGINQYELFQPLSCAQNDAEAIKDFLVTAEGFLPKNSLLMTNTSPPVGEKSSYPTKDNILLFLEDLAQSWQPQDYLWFFFSGYGVNDNDKDYLMPADGNPDQVLETGIEVRKIMESLAAAKLNVLLIFDINRAFGTQADAPVGQDIINAAKELNIPVMLSCQPEQFSHESTELNHGFFTAALMAALRSCPGGNLKDLESYVSSLTPQLCQHHWRPIQNPATVIPENSPGMLPVSGLNENSEPTENIFPEESFAVLRSTAPQPQESQPSTYKAWWAENQTANKSSETTISNNSQPDGKSILATSPELKTGSRFIPAAAKNYAKPAPSVSTPIWQQFIIWGGGSMVIVGLMTTFLLRNQASFRFNKISTSLNNNSNNNNTTTRSSEFADSLPPIPNNIPTTSPSNLPRVSNSDPQKRNQAISELGKMSLSSTQPSDLSQAITIAQKILPGEPLYQQAQENIQVWSQMILDLAQEQAQQRNYTDAIATAALIPQNSVLYPQTQATIKKWRLEAKQYNSNQTILDAAQGLIQPGQASTYNRAIAVAKKVPPEQPGFNLAQQSMNRWSEEILDLAKARAAQGDFTTAIETASLIPESTVAYEDAQDAIQKWRGKFTVK